MISSPITSWQIDGETVESVTDFIFLGSKITEDGCLLLERKEKPRQHIKKQRRYFTDKDLSSQGYDFSRSHVWMWELDCKEGWSLKIWCFWTVVLEKTCESPLDSKEIKPVNSKGNWFWLFIGRTEAEAEAPILWPPDAKTWLIGKDPDAGEDWGQEEKGTTEDEMVGWHLPSAYSMDMGSRKLGELVKDREAWCVAVCGGHKELDMTERLNSNNSNLTDMYWEIKASSSWHTAEDLRHCIMVMITVLPKSCQDCCASPRKPDLKETRAPQCSSQHCLS